MRMKQLVDRLLESPHYGERMAMYWLDLVRYADTLGYHGDQDRSVSPYRDYVIAAFNDNMPFDQFTRENLAGDLLPDATMMQRVASTYNRLNRASAEGGVQPKEYLAKYAADRVRTTGSVWLGSTFGCAECHDHKFDPFTAKDFYSFAAFFADVKEQGIVPGAVHIEQLPVPTAEQQQEMDRLAKEIQAAETELNLRTEEMETQFAEWRENELKNHAGQWQVIRPTFVQSSGGATFAIQDDGSVLVSGTSPDKDTYTIESSVAEANVTAIRLEVLPDATLPGQGPGRAGNGNFVVQTVALEVNGRTAKWASASATHSQDGFPIDHLAQGNSRGWAILPRAGTAQQAVLVLQQPADKTADHSAAGEEVAASGGYGVKFTVTQDHGAQHTLGRFRLSYTTALNPPSATQVLPEEVVVLLQIDPQERSEAQNDQLWQQFRETSPAREPARNRLAGLRAQRKKVQDAVITTLGTAAGPPREMRVLPRGQLDG